MTNGSTGCMTITVSCPQCSQPVDTSARICEHCGVDLAMAAALAERDVQPSNQNLVGYPVTPEVLVPRLGDYLVEKGVLTTEELDQALRYQETVALKGRTLLLGQALREMGLVDAETLDQAITVQIFQLQSALQQSNRQLERRVQERTKDLQQALNKLTELSQLKANFIANISHELRTPLTHIKGYLDILLDGSMGSLNAEQKDALDVLQRSELRLEQLIEDLIQFSMASRGELSLKLASNDLVSLAQMAVKQSAYKANAGGIKLAFQKSDSIPPVTCDGDKIFWVMTQLLDNAIKFTARGGKVQLEITNQSDLITVAVTDTGIGIPPGSLAEIYEPFHQLDGSSTRRYGGTGIGLALSNQILSAHNSVLRVRSKVGYGSCFEFGLPVAEID